jgi:hypothetical protein
MNIELKELLAVLGERNAAPVRRDLGIQIVVADRGYVYVGKTVIEGDFVTMTEARNIRYWGTTKGLGELVNGPLKDTKLDDTGEILLPLKAVIHFITCKQNW